MHSADQMDLLDKWDPEFEDTLSLDEIYQERSRLAAFEEFISPGQGQNGLENPDKEVTDDTNAGKDSEDNPETQTKTARRIALSGANGASMRENPTNYNKDIACQTARETIRQIRLVCRLFNDLASPLLCPILRVDLDQESLNGAVELCKRPRIAGGVHAIQVGLQYRPEELVSDCPRFKDYCKQQLDRVADRCDWLGGYELDDETDCLEDKREFREAKRNYQKICRSWDAYFSTDESDENDDVAEAEADEHMEILIRAYNEYCKKHEEQLQLITSGAFVTALAACISQLPNTVTLGFTDEMEPLYDWDNPTIVLGDTSLLPGMMSAALRWEKIDNLRHGNDPVLTRDARFTPARILFDLPVAIHKAGIKLRNLDLGPFPCRGSFSLLCPDTVSNPTDPAVWSALRAACSSLWRVNFGMNQNHHRPHIRHEHLRPDEKFYVDQTSAHAVNWPRIERISISHVSSKQQELESFCSGLGPSTRRLSLYAIHLLDGSWEGILCTLDEKMRSTFHEQNVTVYLSDLTGGEFGEVEINERLFPLGFEDSDDDMEPPKPPPAAGGFAEEAIRPILLYPVAVSLPGSVDSVQYTPRVEDQ
ncbi:hypothetical protein KXX44_004999 [Aspergillus fumigatus]|nr:hypothetical protein KXX11_001108 [Aspergillus fumigatus]KAH1599812.1 hypothetical protein KXX44_004999 [Aspergillus fumigatus]KAH1639457.1 hypothetical protein KXX39_003955 [Aspergillus fumigatus]KAH1661484.1 hypothetical protein KXX15_001168 [Aspergillus fumigatus]